MSDRRELKRDESPIEMTDGVNLRGSRRMKPKTNGFSVPSNNVPRTRRLTEGSEASSYMDSNCDFEDREYSLLDKQI
jgi:hypothetical protein